MKKKWLWVLVPLAAAAAVAIWFFANQSNLADEVIIEAGSQPLASDWLLQDKGKTAVFETDLATLDLTKPGLYPITLSYDGKSYPVSLRVRDTQPPQGVTQSLTAYNDALPQAQDFVTRIADFTDVTVTYKTQPDGSRAGDQAVTLLLTDEGGNTAELTATLTLILDESAPQIGGIGRLVHYVGKEADFLAGVTVTDDQDPAPALTVDSSRVDTAKAGEYDIVYSATDAAGNCRTVITGVTVIEDTQAPVLYGLRNLNVRSGGTVSYRAGVAVDDNTDAAPTLTVDSSAVNLVEPGDYPVTYTATDAAGNTVSKEITITVWERSYYTVDESEIWAEADRIISQIITEGMTVEEQVRAIYRWMRLSYTYNGYADGSDWKQNAYELIVTGRGDCFSYFALSKLLFERLGIPNIDIQRLQTWEHTGDHYWSMVSLDGGETWYHYDSTPFETFQDTCLVTDADLDEFSRDNWNCYNRDRSAYPSTPTQRP